MEHEDQGNNNSSCCTRNGLQEPGEINGEKGNQWENQNHPGYNIHKNTEMSPGDLRKLAVSQTPEKTHQAMLMWKTRKG